VRAVHDGVAIEIERCARCGAMLRIIANIEEPRR
jgi:hypothetical protein